MESYQLQPLTLVEVRGIELLLGMANKTTGEMVGINGPGSDCLGAHFIVCGYATAKNKAAVVLSEN